MGAKENHQHYLRKMAEHILNNSIDGCFIECGVQKGHSVIVLAQTLNREGYLFDTWHGFPTFSGKDAETHDQVKRMKKLRRKQSKNTYKECIYNLKKAGVLKRCQMIKGDICNTVPEFIKNNKLSISIMHIDTDVYEPAKVSLESFWEFISPGGLVFFHDYGEHRWPGVTKIVDEFAEENNLKINVCKVEYSRSAVLEKDTDKVGSYLSSIRV